MANSKLFLATFVLAFVVLNVVQAQEMIEINNNLQRSLLGIDCGAACETRCKLSSRPNLCHRACGTCCARCGCVPPGTSGNEKECPCYYNQRTHGGERKCP
ncbi:gibberellin-regulated protein 11-like [Chenopodium quinoa]|uniref:Snakin-2 n=1 Tax=Chenopodium quinoa TaxID=63459 RepID=A0A803N7X7_CHEQI|nr:gibberellin-regulated protein 11-like [Chenopodium quinoa]